MIDFSECNFDSVLTALRKFVDLDKLLNRIMVLDRLELKNESSQYESIQSHDHVLRRADSRSASEGEIFPPGYELVIQPAVRPEVLGGVAPELGVAVQQVAAEIDQRAFRDETRLVAAIAGTARQYTILHTYTEYPVEGRQESKT